MSINKIVISVSIFLLVIALTIVLSMLVLPSKLFNNDFSTVVLDRNGRLLGAKLSEDEQWRFQSNSKVAEKFKTAILAYEDQYFYSHPGINPISVIKALADNIRAGRIIRGGSTISMQVIRLSRNGKERTVGQKIIESFLTIGLEVLYTKDSILDLYCSNAPMGGNIVGLRAASWRYFGHSEHELSWAEAATLAVLPNSPSIIHPGKNRTELTSKRNKLLRKLLDLNHIDSIRYNLALLEEIPGKPYPIPQEATHLVEYIASVNCGEIVKTTIDIELQKCISQIVVNHMAIDVQNGINNTGVLITNSKNREILAYMGNVPINDQFKVKYAFNDMVRARRSTGSILKPLLFAAMTGEGIILPNSLVRDIPSYFDNYHPENYDYKFRGAVPASAALSQSLNVPSVYMLQSYGTAKFLRLLHKLGFTSFNNSASHYGLSLILGGGETSLMELVSAYTGMASTLNSYDNNYGEYPNNAYGGLNLYKNEENHNTPIKSFPPLTASSIWLTYEALKKVSRPNSEIGWENFRSSMDIAWKTGTSHGFKDAWSIGTTADYVVGVWVGNADGEGRDGLTGTTVAAPIMFDIFNVLENNSRFYPAYDEMVYVSVCKLSGNLVSPYCKEVDTIYVPVSAERSNVCSYHKLIFTDEEMQYRLSQKCSPVSEMRAVSWFILPPVQEFYFKSKNPGYETLPPFAYGCEPDNVEGEIEYIYPVSNSSVYVTKGENQQFNEVVFEISHHYPDATIYWHLDNKLIGITEKLHQLPYVPNSGKHILTVVDNSGRSKSVEFKVVN